MTDGRQGHLFRLPRAVQITNGLTQTQRGVLDWVAFNEGRLATFPHRLTKQSLRRVIEKKLVSVTGNSPAVYKLTPTGRLVRTHHAVRVKQEATMRSLVASAEIEA